MFCLLLFFEEHYHSNSLNQNKFAKSRTNQVNIETIRKRGFRKSINWFILHTQSLRITAIVRFCCWRSPHTTISSAVRGEWRKISLVHLADQCPSINHPCMLSLLYFGCRCWSRGKGIRLSRLLILLYCTNVFCVSHLASLFLDSWSSTDSLCVNGSWFHLALVFAVVKNLKLNWIEIVLSSTSLLKRRQWLKELLSFSVQAYCHLQLHDRLILFSSFYQGQATWKVGVTSHIHNHMKTLYFLCFNLLNFDIFMIMFLSVWKFAWGTDTHGFVGIPRNIEFVSSFWLRSSRSTLIADSWRVCFN